MERGKGEWREGREKGEREGRRERGKGEWKEGRGNGKREGRERMRDSVHLPVQKSLSQ